VSLVMRLSEVKVRLHDNRTLLAFGIRETERMNTQEFQHFRVLERKPRKKRNSIVRHVRASVQRYNISIPVRTSAMIESK